MGDRVLLVVAEDKGELVAGALNLIGGETLYGRNWGCVQLAHYDALHFEACYYQVSYVTYFHNRVDVPTTFRNIHSFTAFLLISVDIVGSYVVL